MTSAIYCRWCGVWCVDRDTFEEQLADHFGYAKHRCEGCPFTTSYVDQLDDHQMATGHVVRENAVENATLEKAIEVFTDMSDELTKLKCSKLFTVSESSSSSSSSSSASSLESLAVSSDEGEGEQQGASLLKNGAGPSQKQPATDARIINEPFGIREKEQQKQLTPGKNTIKSAQNSNQQKDRQNSAESSSQQSGRVQVSVIADEGTSNKDKAGNKNAFGTTQKTNKKEGGKQQAEKCDQMKTPKIKAKNAPSTPKQPQQQPQKNVFGETVKDKKQEEGEGKKRGRKRRIGGAMVTPSPGGGNGESGDGNSATKTPMGRAKNAQTQQSSGTAGGGGRVLRSAGQTAHVGYRRKRWLEFKERRMRDESEEEEEEEEESGQSSDGQGENEEGGEEEEEKSPAESEFSRSPPSSTPDSSDSESDSSDGSSNESEVATIARRKFRVPKKEVIDSADEPDTPRKLTQSSAEMEVEWDDASTEGFLMVITPEMEAAIARAIEQSEQRVKRGVAYEAEFKIQCLHCHELVANNDRSVHNHVNSHLRFPLFQCPICPLDFYTVSTVEPQEHMREVHGEESKYGLKNNKPQYLQRIKDKFTYYFGQGHKESAIGRSMYDKTSPKAKAGGRGGRARTVKRELDEGRVCALCQKEVHTASVEKLKDRQLDHVNKWHCQMNVYECAICHDRFQTTHVAIHFQRKHSIAVGAACEIALREHVLNIGSAEQWTLLEQTRRQCFPGGATGTGGEKGGSDFTNSRSSSFSVPGSGGGRGSRSGGGGGGPSGEGTSQHQTSSSLQRSPEKCAGLRSRSGTTTSGGGN